MAPAWTRAQDVVLARKATSRQLCGQRPRPIGVFRAWEPHRPAARDDADTQRCSQSSPPLAGKPPESPNRSAAHYNRPFPYPGLVTTLAPSPIVTAPSCLEGVLARPCVDGKFLAVEGERFLIKGAAYGTFMPDADGRQFPPAEQIAEDFAAMANAGINTVRTYTEPPTALLDLASGQGLRVLAGVAWPQHLPFLDSPRVGRQIRQEVASATRRLAAHPATLMVAVGNEIPASIVRWHGPSRVERFLRELYRDAKSAAPVGLLTYVNFPPTEYLDLSYFDVCAFNVYLHREKDLRAYIARLQHIAGDRPLLLAEAGSDSIREGETGQAALTSMQLRAAFTEGACGAVAYAWTDEWWRGGKLVDDWAFGLVDATRKPKPSLAAVAEVFEEGPFPGVSRSCWPRTSVIVCAYNATDTIDDCLASLARLTYPDVGVIVVNDGSLDDTSAKAHRHAGVHVIDIPNGGLGAARNVGLAAATGEIVAYTDADCRVDPDWLSYLVQPLLTSDLAGVGGPNIVPADDPWVAQCVARAPGGPTHVMLDDRVAEHVPGCNMAFRRDALLSIDGFNPVYRRAGDDVDICWRLQARNLRIGFAPSALVWHHRRASVKAYWHQQVGYGEAETWLAAHHPERFLGGQMLWHGRIYSSLPFLRPATGQRINSGVWGTAAFPSVYMPQAHPWHFLPHAPGWIAASLLLLFVGVFGPFAGMDAAWLPLIAGAGGLITTATRCIQCGWRSDLTPFAPMGRSARRRSRLLNRALIAGLHLIQPFARLTGRLRGLSRPAAVMPQHVTRYPWKTPMPTLHDAVASARLFTRSGSERSFWSESSVSHTMLLTELVGVLRSSRPTLPVDVDEGWRPDRDFSLAIGRWAWLHVGVLVEEHAAGRSLVRVRTRLRPSFVGTARGLGLAVLLATATSVSFFLYEPSVGVTVSAIVVAATAARAVWQAARAAAALGQAVTRVATSAGMAPLPVGHLSRAVVRPPEETTPSEP